MKLIKAKVFIYAIKAKNGRIMYVGATIDLAARWSMHTKIRRQVPGARLVVLKATDFENFPYYEHKMIRRYQPKFNVSPNQCGSYLNTRRDWPDTSWCIIPELGLIFNHTIAVSQLFRVGHQPVLKAVSLFGSVKLNLIPNDATSAVKIRYIQRKTALKKLSESC